MNGEEGRFWMLFLANPRRLQAAPTWPTRGVIFPDRSPPERFSVRGSLGKVEANEGGSRGLTSPGARRPRIDPRANLRTRARPQGYRHAFRPRGASRDFRPVPPSAARQKPPDFRERGFISRSDRPRRPAVREYPRSRSRVDGLDPPRRRREMRYPRAS